MKKSRSDRAEFRSVATRIGTSLLIFLGLFTILSTVYQATVQSAGASLDKATAYVISESELAIGYFLTFFIPAILLISFTRKTQQPSFENVIPNVKKRSLPYLILFTISAGTLTFALINNLIVNFIGEMEIPMQNEPYELYQIFFVVLTTAVVPAIVEELLFRKAILGALLPYGKTTAIIASAILFGLMHQNVLQIIYASVAGIFLGFIYVETRSYLCVFLIHFANNLFSVIQQIALQNLPSPANERVAILLEAVVLILGIFSLFMLIIKHRQNKKDVRATGSFEKLYDLSFEYKQKKTELERSPMVLLFSSPTVLIFTILCAASILLQILMMLGIVDLSQMQIAG